MRSLRGQWINLGHRVTLVAPKPHPRLQWMREATADSGDDGLGRVARVPLLFASRRGVWIVSAPRFYHTIRHICRTDRPDVVFVHYVPWNCLGWAAYMAAHPLNIPVVARVHDIYRPVGMKDRFFDLVNNRALLPRLSHIEATNQSSRCYLSRTYSIADNRVLIRPNGLNLDRYRPLGQALESGNCAPTICYVGALNGHRGLEQMAAIYARVRAKVSDCKLLIIGDGAGRQQLLAEADRLGITDSIEITGALSVPLMVNRLRDVHVGLGTFDTASNYAEFQMLTKALDYTAMGIPWVSFSTPGVQDLCHSVGSGIAVPADIEVAAETVAALLLNKNMRRDMAHRGLSNIERYDWRRQAEQIADDMKRAVISSREQRTKEGG
ncbi:MAG: glycosyltransferase [Chloroflexi bacterium]|nr:glycosyltransferase [Chloroflexota bacterium]